MEKSFLQTGMDKNVPYFGVIMEKHDPTVYPKYELPQGFYFAEYERGFEKKWAVLNSDVGHTDSPEDGEKIFIREYMGYDIDTIRKKTIFIMDEKDNLAGVGSVWDGDDFGETFQRLHWIAVSSNYQNKGLSKVIVSRALDIYNNLGYRGYIYLTSQTWSYKALNVYSHFGFVPYMGEKPKNWNEDGSNNPELDFQTKNKKAWDIVNEKLNLYKNQKHEK